MTSGARGKLEKEICDALGLKHVQKLDLHFEVGHVATVEARFYPEVDGVKQFPAILRKFELVPKPDMEDTTEFGDDWRTHRIKTE